MTYQEKYKKLLDFVRECSDDKNCVCYISRRKGQECYRSFHEEAKNLLKAMKE